MATVAVTKPNDQVHARVYAWDALTTTNADGAPVEIPDHADRSVQVFGTFGAGGTCTIQGSNDGVTWHTLNDPQGDPLAITVAGIYQVQELSRHIRPNVTAGDGTTNLDVFLYARAGR